MSDMKPSRVKKAIALMVNFCCWILVSIISTYGPVNHVYTYVRGKAILTLHTQQIFKQCVKLFL
jgi:hypothetical protein